VGGVLRNIANAAAALIGVKGLSHELDAPAAAGNQTQDGTKQRALAPSIGAGDAYELARLDLETDVVQDALAAEVHAQVLDVQGKRVHWQRIP
jgi:hypothetical protein